jgi:HSP20 family protein
MTKSKIIPRIRENNYLPLSMIQDSVNDLFDNFFSEMHLDRPLSAIREFPSLDVSESDKMVIVKAELPSIKEKDIKVDIHKNRLFISGEKKSEKNEERQAYHIKEISYGSFSRSIVLPFDIDPNSTEANFSNSVLTIKIEKPEEEKRGSKSIPINTTS